MTAREKLFLLGMTAAGMAVTLIIIWAHTRGYF